ncbi:MAG: hypothetical protein KA368_20755 [Acidobacteria bacterium]|nr:hypothetical protein [Acidobacteriota bacterium]
MFSINVRTLKSVKIMLVAVVFATAVQAGHLVYSTLKANGMRTIKANDMRIGDPVPFTVKLSEVFHGPDGTTADTQESIWAIRSDGALVRHIMQKQSKQTSERTIKFISGDEVVINELTNIKSSTLEKGVNPARWQRDPASKCINSFAGTVMTSLPEVVNGEEIVNGYRTVKITANNVTSWFALDYGCAVVRDKADWGANKGYSEHNLVSLVPGEPAPALFQVPINAKEAPPSERLLSSETDGASHCGARCRELLQKFDVRYYANRPTK